jgi:hypothetical protein
MMNLESEKIERAKLILDDEHLILQVKALVKEHKPTEDIQTRPRWRRAVKRRERLAG